MKKILKSILLVASIAIFFTSCQSEEVQISSDNTNLTSNTPLTDLLGRVSKKSTSKDNIIDGTSCFMVNLPVTVIVNGQEETIIDEAGYVAVQNILNEFNDDDDEVSFVFPITITFSDYTTTVVANNEQLDEIVDHCGDGNEEVEIECLSINYPITISYYNAGSQTPSTVTIESDSQLYNFFEDFEDDDYAVINYPISVTDADGNQVVVSNNDELETIIKTADDDCDDDNDDDIDDDDDDDDDNLPISPNFTSVLQSGEWHVTYFFDESDETSNYQGYSFSFGSDGVVSVFFNSTNLSGEWKAYVDDNEDTLELGFPSQLEELSDDWEIIEYSPTQIRLKDVSGENGEIDYLTFTKN